MHVGSYFPKRGYSTISSHASVPKNKASDSINLCTFELSTGDFY